VVSNINALNRYRYSGHSALMGKRECRWQDTGYVLSFFGKSLSMGRDHYYAYVKDGVDQGRRPELVGGGIIRSLGGWAEARRVRLKGQDRMKGDERILGDGDFVRGLFCYWAVRELGYGQAELARRLGMTQPGVGYAVKRGEHIAKENNFLLTEK
jgi:hypothetical protein